MSRSTLFWQKIVSILSARMGGYYLILGIAENRMVFDVRLEDGIGHRRVVLSLTPFRCVLKDYLNVCASYYAAIRDAMQARIESIEKGWRGLHDQGSDLLIERLASKIAVDFETTCRLFTLICALSLKI